jgi:hypothetical protein
MKVYIVQPTELPVSGVFQTLDAALAAFPGNYSEEEFDGRHWWHDWDTHIDITEWEVRL